MQIELHVFLAFVKNLFQSSAEKKQTIDFSGEKNKPMMLTDVLLVLAFFMLIALARVLMVCVLRRKRKTEGTYRPSAEEQKQAESQESKKPGLSLPLPKEERLI
ncbi:hypothetical protein Q7C36_022212 [Tachysurus vachellii]|uniref:Uncharacterized protein n=1 Tax=Tachysurus vachellii TaxID=175792 RepID=A0AA88IQ38_TACVA|nr:hypothetical protein Q7C36_022212 [Tachysurus vachellii]